MGNISYDPSRRIRSAAGTARTTPGIPGTASNPREGTRYGSNPAYGATPSTPPASSTPHLSKAAGGKGAGVGGQKPQWMQNSQARFQRRMGFNQRNREQHPSTPPSFGAGPQATQMSQVGPAAPQMWQNGRAPQPYTPSPFPSASPEAAPAAAAPAPDGSHVQFQAMMQDPRMQNEFQNWWQQRVQAGLL